MRKEQLTLAEEWMSLNGRKGQAAHTLRYLKAINVGKQSNPMSARATLSCMVWCRYLGLAPGFACRDAGIPIFDRFPTNQQEPEGKRFRMWPKLKRDFD